MREKGIVRFLVEQQNRLSCIVRFNNTPKVSQESVAEHSYYVSLMALLVSDYLLEKGLEIDQRRLLCMTLLHDVEEIISGDIIKVLKTSGLKAELDKLNEKSMQYLTGTLESAVGKEYYDFWHDSKEKKTTEALLVDFCDWLAVVVYSIREIHLGNRYFEEILEYSLKAIPKFSLALPLLDPLILEFIRYSKSFLGKEVDVLSSLGSAVRLDVSGEEEE